MEFDHERLKFELMDCFDEDSWSKYDFDELVNNYSEDTDFIIVRGSNFRALFDKTDLDLVNLDIMEVGGFSV